MGRAERVEKGPTAPDEMGSHTSRTAKIKNWPTIWMRRGTACTAAAVETVCLEKKSYGHRGFKKGK